MLCKIYKQQNNNLTLNFIPISRTSATRINTLSPYQKEILTDFQEIVAY